MSTIDALQALFVNNPSFDALERFNDRFCAFEAIGMVKQEIRHAHFLGYCMDPQRPHGFGTEVLRCFLRSAADVQGGEGGLTSLDVHLLDCDNAQIRREWRRIDLLAIVPNAKIIVAIELKIDAGEHGQQLQRYRDIVRSEWPRSEGWRHLFVYLTKVGEAPREAGGEYWIALDLDSIALELQSVIDKGRGVEAARDLLAAYIAMLRRHHLTDARIEELAAKLWSQHREALEFLMERKPDGNGVMGILHQRREALALAMSAVTDRSVILDDCTPSTLRFAVADWDDVPDLLSSSNWTSSGRILLLEVAPDGDRNAIRARFVLGRADPNVRQTFYEALTRAIPNLTRRREITGVWTRLGTETLARGLKLEHADPEHLADIVAGKLESYARVQIPLFDHVLNALRGP